MTLLKRLAAAAFNIGAGFLIGVLLLEATLRCNPRLLLRGMGLLMPVDPPITHSTYEVRASDADVFYWHADVIRPIPPEADRLEAVVTYETDELGFPNTAPVPETVDVLVLGRSFSAGLQASMPWTRALANLTGLKVLNLSQAASGIDLKLYYLRKYGLPHHPRWVVLEVLPSLDILGYTGMPDLLVSQLPVHMFRVLARQNMSSTRPQANPIYPLEIRLENQTVPLTFFFSYLDALTINPGSIKASQQWARYQEGLGRLVDVAETEGVCVILLYALTKEEVYFTLAEDPSDLQPAASLAAPWILGSDMRLVKAPIVGGDVDQMQSNAADLRGLIQDLALEMGLTLADPAPRFLEGARAGVAPYMSYDTHWSAQGHQWVADIVADALQAASCP